MGDVYEDETYKNYHIVFDTHNMYIYRPDSYVGFGEDKKYQIDDSEKNMLRLARNWIDDDIVSRMPAPPISELVWIPVTERYPDDSRQVLIREGNNIATAHWFDSIDRETTGGALWVNQHQRIFGSYIENPTHWMDIVNLLAIPTSDKDSLMKESDCKCKH